MTRSQPQHRHAQAVDYDVETLLFRRLRRPQRPPRESKCVKFNAEQRAVAVRALAYAVALADMLPAR